MQHEPDRVSVNVHRAGTMPKPGDLEADLERVRQVALGKEGERAGLDGGGAQRLGVVHRHHHHRAARMALAQRARGLDAVRSGQLHVHQHQVERRLVGARHRLLQAARLAQLERRQRGEQPVAQRGAHFLVVFHHEQRQDLVDQGHGAC